MTERELLFSLTPKDKSIRRDTFRSGGPGGQNQNKVESGVRFTHLPSKAVGESREHRSQHANEKAAWQRMVDHPAFRWWVHQESRRIETGKTLEERVAEDMREENLKVEVQSAGKWIPEA